MRRTCSTKCNARHASDGMEGTYPPFNYKNEKGELDGFDVEIAKALAAKLT